MIKPPSRLDSSRKACLVGPLRYRAVGLASGAEGMEVFPCLTRHGTLGQADWIVLHLPTKTTGDFKMSSNILKAKHSECIRSMVCNSSSDKSLLSATAIDAIQCYNLHTYAVHTHTILVILISYHFSDYFVPGSFEVSAFSAPSSRRSCHLIGKYPWHTCKVLVRPQFVDRFVQGLNMATALQSHGCGQTFLPTSISRVIQSYCRGTGVP